MNDLDTRIAGLSPARQALLARMLRERRAAGRPQITPSGDTGPAPLSAAQRQFWFLWQQDPESSGVYNVPMALRLRGAINAGTIDLALRRIIERHAVLRTRYVDGEAGSDGPVAVTSPNATGFSLAVEDVTALPADEREEAARAIVDRRATHDFDLAAELPLRAVLIRLDDEDHVLAVIVHHIATDGASVEILFREFAAISRAVQEGEPLALPELPVQYADYARWQQSGTGAERLAEGLDFWGAWLDGADPSLDLPTDRLRPADGQRSGGRRRRRIEPELAERVHAFSREHGVTPFMTLLTGLGLVLRRYSGKSDLLVGTPAMNRPTAETEHLIGCFANTLALRLRLDAGHTAAEAVRRIRQDVTAAYEYQDVPFEKVVARTGTERSLDRNPLFQVMFVYQRVADGFGLPGVEAETFDTHNGTAKFDLDFSLLDGPRGIEMSCEYDAGIFTAQRIDRMLAHLEQALVTLIEAPDTSVADLGVLTAEEEGRAALEWNATAADFPRERTLPDLFAEQAAARPDAPAVRTPSGTVSYGELARRSSQLTRVLARRGVGRGEVVAVAVERTADLPLAVLGVLGTGAAYLPVDPDQPAERLTMMLQDAGVRAVVTTGAVHDRLPAVDVPVLVLDADEVCRELDTESDAPVACPADAGDLSYMIFTSGSTGRPKGVLLDHRGRVNNFHDFNRRFDISTGDAVLSVSSLGFDMTAYDLLGTLIAGACAVLPAPERDRDPSHWLDLMREHRVTVWHSVPALLGLLLDGMDDLGVEALPDLRVVLLGGDWIPVTLPGRLRTRARDARVIGLGGATEASMDSTIFEIEQVDPGWQSIPYGVPMANQTAYVTDGDLRLVPQGVPGELYLGGTGLAWGYADAPGQTADRFPPNPFSGVPGDRMYRTGDLARYRPDGSLELLGRVDFQVKIAGHRIELGEVEAALRDRPGVGRAVAAAVTIGEQRRLVGYVVREEGAGPVDTTAVREDLATRLPGYMVPAFLVELAELPLSPNGKVDRGRLPVPSTPAAAATRTAGRPPATPTELLLAGVWQELLGLESLSATDGFFALGGDSVTCIRMVTRARAAGLAVTPRMVFQHQTVEELAEAVDASATTLAETSRQTAGSPGGTEVPLDRYPLAPIQHHMLTTARQRPFPGLYVIQSGFPLPGELDETAFRRAWEWLFARHAVLRTYYEDLDTDTPVQVVADRVEPWFEERDLRGLDPATQERRLLTELDELRLAGFDLGRPPLIRLLRYRISDDLQLLVQHHHYSLLDGWSCMRLRQELLLAYQAFATGTEPEAAPARPFAEHVAWVGSLDRDAAAAHWAGVMEGSAGPWALAPQRTEGRPTQVQRSLDPRLTERLDAAARNAGTTYATFAQLAWARVIADRSGHEDVVFGVTSNGRQATAEAEAAVGPFISTLPVRFRFAPDEPVTAAVRRLHLQRLEAEDFNGVELAVMTGGRPLESVLVFDNYPVDASLGEVSASVQPGNPLAQRSLSVAQTEFPIRVDVLRGAEDALVLTFAGDREPPHDADELADRWVAALGDLAERSEAGPETPGTA
ncbi:amino acid adenylation domain-containing protein [Streptomyces griseus]|uniref:amino acid adenylation domain-containing protein n=1 Tax=Streptomyces griseus TaxID=1911 RepID=UPI0037B1AD25